RGALRPAGRSVHARLRNRPSRRGVPVQRRGGRHARRRRPAARSRGCVAGCEVLRNTRQPVLHWFSGGELRRPAYILALAAAICGAATFAPAAGASTLVRFQRIDGFKAPGTPAKYNKVGILKTGPRSARNVLILNPGTSSSAAYFEPLAKTLAGRRAPGWQVW